jgi:LysE type translocator
MVRVSTSLIRIDRMAIPIAIKLSLNSTPLLALSGHSSGTAQCQLSRVKRTSRLALKMSAFDPKRASSPEKWCAMIIDHQIIAFAGIAALLTITPGQDTVLVIRNVMAQGQRAGLLTTFGICCGLFVHATLSAVGLSLILLKSATAFEVVKLLGAAYLIWLGAQSLWQALHGSNQAFEKSISKQRSANSWPCFVQGFLTNILNRKVAVF